MTYAQLAQLSGVPKGTLIKITTGETKNPRIETLEALARALECSISDFSDGYIGMDRKSISDYWTMNPHEAFIVNLYRNLNPHGRRMVELVMTEELEHMKDIKRNEAKKEAEKHGREEGAPHELHQLPLYECPASAGSGAFVGEGEFVLADVPEAAPAGVAYGVKIKGCSMEPKIPDGAIVWVRLQADVEVGDICVVVIDDEGYCKVKRDGYFESLNPDYENIYPASGQRVSIKGLVKYVQT